LVNKLINLAGFFLQPDMPAVPKAKHSVFIMVNLLRSNLAYRNNIDSLLFFGYLKIKYHPPAENFSRRSFFPLGSGSFQVGSV
jgi:hypothetical protein